MTDQHQWDGKPVSVIDTYNWAMTTAIRNGDPRQISVNSTRDGSLRLDHGQTTTYLAPGDSLEYSKDAGFSKTPGLGDDIPRTASVVDLSASQAQLLAATRRDHSQLDAFSSYNAALQASISRHPAGKGLGPTGR